MSRDTFRIDSHKLIYHPERAAQVLAAQGDWQRAKSVYPIYMEVALMGACNHRCVFCAVDYIGYQSVRLDHGLLAQRIPEMARLGVKSIMFAGEGEPLLHKQAAEIVTMTKSAGIDVAFTTNCTVLPPGFLEQGLPACSWLKVSINAGTPATYAAIHQTKESDFARVIDNMSRMVQARRAGGFNCTLGAQALLLDDNAHEMETLARLCRDEVGLDYLVIKPYSQHLFSTTERYKGIDYQQFLQLGERLAALNTDRFSLIFRGHTMQKYADKEKERYDRCYAVPFLWAYIMADGTVSGCSAFLKDERFEYGNIREHSFRDIWEGERRRQSFHLVSTELDIAECRVNCRMDEVNRYLHQIHRQSIPHINFI
ncbi:MAG: radical SAM protein [Magnetococcales bacterium]|nr:radical SAM protein [Magnetococcales bacterium]